MKREQSNQTETIFYKQETLIEPLLEPLIGELIESFTEEEKEEARRILMG